MLIDIRALGQKFENTIVEPKRLLKFTLILIYKRKIVERAHIRIRICLEIELIAYLPEKRLGFIQIAHKAVQRGEV